MENVQLLNARAENLIGSKQRVRKYKTQTKSYDKIRFPNVKRFGCFSRFKARMNSCNLSILLIAQTPSNYV